MKKQNVWFAIMLAVFTLLYATGHAGSEGKLTKATGTLTSIEQDGTVIIDGSGYGVSSTARIYGGREGRTSLDKLLLPVRVQFEYEHTNRGPVIKVLKEMPQ